jgi:hypothetical protein
MFGMEIELIMLKSKKVAGDILPKYLFERKKIPFEVQRASSEVQNGASRVEKAASKVEKAGFDSAQPPGLGR